MRASFIEVRIVIFDAGVKAERKPSHLAQRELQLAAVLQRPEGIINDDGLVEGSVDDGGSVFEGDLELRLADDDVHVPALGAGGDGDGEGEFLEGLRPHVFAFDRSCGEE